MIRSGRDDFGVKCRLGITDDNVVLRVVIAVARNLFKI